MEGGIAIIKGAQPANRNGDVDFPFRQNSDFYYLTGFEEPFAALILLPEENKKFIMFVRNRNFVMENWDGKRAGIEGAMQEYGADTALGISLFEKELITYLKGKNNIYLNTGDKEFVTLVDSLYKKANGNIDKKNININKIIAEMRVIKVADEIELIKKACNITSEAQVEAIKAAKPGMKEYELAAIIEYIFKKDGADYTSFPTIIGSGINSTILHHEAGNKEFENNDMIVMDIGCEYKNYASDITRSIPADGKFTKVQKEIYEIVLKANKEAIINAKPGKGLNEIQNYAKDIVTEGLYDLGLITSKEKSWQTDVWLPHGISHFIGLDDHDVGDAGYFTKQGRIVKEGMVFTIEPGIYINKNTLDNLKDLYGFRVDKKELEEFVQKVRPAVEKYNNIGIRIEDTILITKEGCEVLSSKSPKEIDEIERTMQEISKFN
jgi:Xaa-Pro aminopeptidase